MQRRLFIQGSSAALAGTLVGCGGGGGSDAAVADASAPAAAAALQAKTSGTGTPITSTPTASAPPGATASLDTAAAPSTQTSTTAAPSATTPTTSTAGAGAYTFQQEFDNAAVPMLRHDGGPFNPYFTYFGGAAQPDGPGGIRWWNNELQVYTDSLYTPAPYNPYSISNSVLTITARPAAPEYPNATNTYLSGNLETSNGGWWEDPAVRAARPGFEQKYGYWEARMRMPAGKGLWCAFWLNGGADANGKVGELDIFETIGDGTIYQTIHDWWAATDINGSTAYAPPGFSYSSEFHVYGLRWTSTEIVWYVDGVETKRASDAMVARYRDLCGPMYLAAGMAIGGPGSWPGTPDASTVFPARMDIDYIRVTAV